MARFEGHIYFENWVGNTTYINEHIHTLTIRDGNNNTVGTVGDLTLSGFGNTSVYSYSAVITGLGQSNWRGSYKGDMWLRKNLSTNFVYNGFFGGEHQYLGSFFNVKPGDTYEDNTVDSNDEAKFNEAYGTEKGDDGFDMTADFNGDEIVDVADYAILSANMGLSGDS